MLDLIAQEGSRTMLASIAATNQSNSVALLLPLVLMGGVFYFLLIRPQQRRHARSRSC